MRGKMIALGLSVCAFVALAAQPSFAARPGHPARSTHAAAHRTHLGAGWGDCVRTVRALSNFTVRGDAWMWWQNSAGEYARDTRPKVGSVLVFKRTAHLGRGHVSLVSSVVDRRTVLVDHTWIAGRGVKRGMQVVDVSPNNDWSMVRVWHGPTDQLGQRPYPTYGFILPEGAKPWGDVLQVADRGDADTTFEQMQQDDGPVAVAPAGRKLARNKAKLNATPAFGRMFSPTAASAALMVPPRKPGAHPAVIASSGKPVPAAAAAKIARKPATRASVKKSNIPARKPKAA